MCEGCLLGVCSSRCPNAPAPKAVHICAYCNEAIIAGDEAVELEGNYYHRECFHDNAVDILFNDFGAKSFTAEED